MADLTDFQIHKLSRFFRILVNIYKRMKKDIIFDFDGVIADTFDMCYKIHISFSPQNSVEDYRKKFEGNIYETLSPNVEPKGLIKSNDEYFKLYKPELMKLGVIENMLDVINNLAKDYNLYIVSSTDSSIIREFLAREKLLGCFKEILGSDVGYSKVEKIKMLEEKYQLKSDSSLFITDTLGDIREAEKRQIKSIAVSWGYHSKATLQKGNPITIVQTPLELVEAVRTR